MIAFQKRFNIILFIVALLLCIPIVAMQFTNEVDWGFFDFLVMGILLLGTGLLIDQVLTKVKKTGTRIALCAVVLFALFVVWAELAVGVFGTPFAGS